MGEFGGLKWGPLQPKHLDYKNSEILFIGEKQFPEEGEHEGTEQELSKLEYEDEARVKHLNGERECSGQMFCAWANTLVRYRFRLCRFGEE